MKKSLEALRFEAHERVAVRLAGGGRWSVMQALRRRVRRRVQEALFSLLTLGGAIAAAGVVVLATGVL
jgi:hypothetical protein